MIVPSHNSLDVTGSRNTSTSYRLPDHHSKSLESSSRQTLSSPLGWQQTTLYSPVPAATNRKAVIACLYCRKRKIACGPPLPGSKNNSCK
ncbi:hypothetical protein PILCRDRAFT_733990 [Piloderma croceum F 1598]|uniref:Zn(2)-C6 fungal-type domain-containing protein n=1 Tax=Piloderma croceum (strain F 1598) TaxID=765440 RepID=A0A0C3EKC8_PILCF|nr:hypothetical protein PILCRDRAFT_733990 [Piloderma croceum F 1598]